MSKDIAVLTWASGDTYCELPEFKAFLNSTRTIRDFSDVVIFTHDMSPEKQAELNDSGFIVWRVKAEEVCSPITERHLHYWRYLCHAKVHRHIMHVDSRDVIFQADPRIVLKSYGDLTNEPFVMLVNEGMPPTANGFHLIEQLEYQKDLPLPLKRDVRANYVLNGGIAFGTREEMKAHFMYVWSAGLKNHHLTDQASLNYLWNFLKEDPIYKVAPADFCLTGEAVKDGFSEAEFRDGTFYLKDRPYSLVHQWDRTEHAQEILSHYLQ